MNKYSSVTKSNIIQLMNLFPSFISAVNRVIKNKFETINMQDGKQDEMRANGTTRGQTSG